MEFALIKNKYHLKMEIIVESQRETIAHSTWSHSDPCCGFKKNGITFLSVLAVASSQAEAQFMGIPIVELQL